MKIRVSANKLAEFITAKTPARRKAIVRDIKRPKKGFAPWYAAFRTPAKTFLLRGSKDTSPLDAAIEEMKTRKGNDWLNTDSAITAQALKALIDAGPILRALKVEFMKVPTGPKEKLEFGEVEVTVTPDLIVKGERSGKPLVGALRFYIAKESTYQLGKRGAELVAGMQYQWLVKNATGTRVPDTTLCMVLECFQQRVTKASDDHATDLDVIKRGCDDFARLWHLLDDEEAA